MENPIDLFKEAYSPLLINFKNDLNELSEPLTGIPEIFLPIIGNNYPYIKYRIAFIGMETRGWGSLQEMRKHFNDTEDITDILFRNVEEFNEFEFTKWTNNFGKSFWDYILQFLAAFYKIENWKELKKRSNRYILSSFLWGNSNALERYEVIAKQENVDYQLWFKVKEISKVFDSLELLINSFLPDVVIILNWNIDQIYINGLKSIIGPVKIDEYLNYYFNKNTGTHIIHHAHPNWINREIGYDTSISSLVKLLYNKLNISKNESDLFENQSNYSLMEYKKKYLFELASFLHKNDKVMSGYELVQHFNRNGIKTSYDTKYVYGRGIYTLIRNTWDYYQNDIRDPHKASIIAESYVKENGEYAYE